MNFKEFGLDPRLEEGIDAIGFTTATPIQEIAIPKVLDNKDLIASAQTGTGKTAAFLLPIIHKIIQTKQDEHIKALVVVPTRELAIQIDQQIEGLSYFTPISSIAVYGGGDGSTFTREKKALTVGADVVICTPGRMIAHLIMNYVKMNELEFLVLDEADRMLDMGFRDDIMRIISYIPKKRQTLLFSATMPSKIKTLSKEVLIDPEEIIIAISKPPEQIQQVAFSCYATQKLDLLEYILKKSEKLRSILVFCSTKSATKSASRILKKLDFSVQEIHSDLDQKEREQVLIDFKSKKIKIIVATDILSRGIHIDDIDLVLNYDVPNDAEDYVHRIGRTARAKSKGLAFTFITEKEQGKFHQIEQLLGKEVPKALVPESIGEGPKYKPTIRKYGKFNKKRGRKF